MREGEKKSVVVLGASTGGPPVIERIIIDLPFSEHTTIFVVQHMPKFFTESFAKSLKKRSKVLVREAEGGDVVKAGMVFVAPGDVHIEVARVVSQQGDCVVIHLAHAEGDGVRPSIDRFMSSVASVYGNQTMGIILTGMGTDGMEGMRAIKTARGYTIAQDPETAAVSSMPRSAIDAGVIDEVLPIEKIGQRIAELMYPV